MSVTVSKRNYSFMNRRQESLDTVIGEDQEYVIPAIPGTTYWAILKYCYENRDTPMKASDIVEGSAQILQERDIEKWEKFKNKKNIKTQSNGAVIEKPANDWRKRLETNIKTLTRGGGNNPYGQRLVERGHFLSWDKSFFGNKGGFILRTKQQ